MHKILIVEDDMVIANAIKNHIATWNCEARCVEDFKEVDGGVCRLFAGSGAAGYRTAVFNGYHWCTQIRAVSKVPIIFISSASTT